MDNKETSKKEAAAIKRMAIWKFTLHYYLDGPGKGDIAEARARAKSAVEMLQLFDKLSPEDREGCMWLYRWAADKASPHYPAVKDLLSRFGQARTRRDKQRLADEARALYRDALSGQAH